MQMSSLGSTANPWGHWPTRAGPHLNPFILLYSSLYKCYSPLRGPMRSPICPWPRQGLALWEPPPPPTKVGIHDQQDGWIPARASIQWPEVETSLALQDPAQPLRGWSLPDLPPTSPALSAHLSQVYQFQSWYDVFTSMRLPLSTWERTGLAQLGVPSTGTVHGRITLHCAELK